MVPVIIFTVTSYKIIQRLKAYFPEFYQQYRRKLFWATIGLSVPMTLRCTYELVSFLQPSESEMNTFLDEHEIAVNGIYLVFFDFFPILFQLSTMVFGYIR